VSQDFDGKVVVVTGGSSGLGAAIAVGAAKRGAKAVVVNYASNTADANIIADKIRDAGAEAVLVKGDVSEDSDCRKIAEAAAKFGKVDALANNAGITKMAPDHSDLDALSKEDFLRVYAVNTVGPFMMIRATRGLLNASGKASVVMTSSIAAVLGLGSSLAYGASKGALNTMTISLARALAPNIRVNAICPGFIDTPWFTKTFGAEKAATIRENTIKAAPLKAASTAEDVADSALFFLSEQSRHITGETLMIDAGKHLGFSPLTPR